MNFAERPAIDSILGRNRFFFHREEIVHKTISSSQWPSKAYKVHELYRKRTFRDGEINVFLLLFLF